MTKNITYANMIQRDGQWDQLAAAEYASLPECNLSSADLCASLTRIFFENIVGPVEAYKQYGRVWSSSGAQNSFQIDGRLTEGMIYWC